ncbi:calcium/proton exchanger [Exophiala xenobiotica]|uniref:Calcium/proton exchanger n=1 Tax=Exophiala xenobiotica TaxID=348802 RepID=A0A0D2E1W8_9EURO|nr:calcium/proton exchanger [Exophiala xenobiotica]KIW49433.1 calcium/proton exchanger [Exophiala xenobiotica]
MHRVRAWAHSAAHENKFNPWSQNDEKSTAAGKTSALSQHGQPLEEEKPKPSRLARFLKNVKAPLFHSWVNVLLVFVPVGIAVHFANVDPNIVFALNAVAIIPLAGLLTFATESVAHRLGPTLGALLNVSFGNAVELIIFIIALVKNEIRIVQASLIGSLLANLLLILGMAFLIGGLEYQEQIYDSTVTQMSACLLALAVLSLLIPTAFHASFSDLDAADRAVIKLSRGTSVILLVIYFLYLLFQLKSHAYLYQGTPQHLIDEESAPGFLARFDSTSSSSASSSRASTVSSSAGSKRRVRKRLRAKLGMKRHSKTEEEIEPEIGTNEEAGGASADILEEKTAEPHEISSLPPPSTAPVATPVNMTATSQAGSKPKMPLGARGLSFRTPPVFRSSTNPPGRSGDDAAQNNLRRYRSDPNNRQRANQQNRSPASTGMERRQTSRSTTTQEDDEPPMSQTASIVWLLASTGLVALCAEFLVGSIEHLVDNSPLSEAFVGLIILPIVGNAAEHVTAVTVAAKNKLDLALGVALGSSIQIALFVTPIVVILGWILGKDMSLYFSLFETGSLFVATFIVNFLVLDGRSNYLEGALLCACYVIVAVGAYFFPDGQDQSSLTSGPGN